MSLRPAVTLAAVAAQPTPHATPWTEAVLSSLEIKGLLTYRAFADEYRVWSGTDFDLQWAVESPAAASRTSRWPRSSAPARYHPSSPLAIASVPARSVFDRRYADRHGAADLPHPSRADGRCGAVGGVDDERTASRSPNAAGMTAQVIVGHADEVHAVGSAARELAAHLDVLRSSADLESDWVARRELRERAAAAALALDAALERAFGPAIAHFAG